MNNSRTSFGGLLRHPKMFWLSLLFATTLLDCGVAQAETKPANYSDTTEISDVIVEDTLESQPATSDLMDDGSMPQVTSVTEMRDVQPTDWAYEALRNLVERYGCIVGYPDQSFRGDKAISRYEFAAGLSACADQMERLIAASEAVTREDIEKLQKLSEEFFAELAAIGGRVDNLESRTAFLEDHSFSTTTKLSGLVAINITGATAGDNLKVNTSNINAPLNIRPAARNSITNRSIVSIAEDPQVTMSELVWLNFKTSFTGKDNLSIQLAAGNGNSPANAYTSAGLYNTFGVTYLDQTAGTTPNEFVVRELFYQFPVTDNFQIVVGPRVNWYRYFDNNRYTFFVTGAGSYNSGGSTLLNSIDRGSGAVLLWKINDKFKLNVAYLGENNEFLPSAFFNTASDPSKGIFGPTSTTTVQLTYSPTENINLNILYNYSKNAANVPIYDQNGNLTGFGVGGATGEPIYGVADDGFGGSISEGIAHTVEFNFDWSITDKFGIFGRYTYGTTNINPKTPGRSSGSVDSQSFQVGVGFPDLLKEGALGTISFLMPFEVLGGSKYLVSGYGNGGTQYDLEINYFYPVTSNISIVPAFYVIFNPNNFNTNPTVFVGNIRGQFTF